MRRRFPSYIFLALVGAALCLAPTGVAHAGNEGGSVPATRTECSQCHTDDISYPAFNYGPHGSYSTTTRKCALCHSVHAAAAGAVALLPGATVKSSCEMCHDGTGGAGVYGALAARGVAVGGSHDIDVTNVIPGGNALTGSESSSTLLGEDGNLGCDDCHSPHDADTVNPFQGERFRSASGTMWGFEVYPDSAMTSKLLKRRPSIATTSVAEYGSDWCASCHAGRISGGAVHNHPVDSFASTSTPFNYNNVAVLSSDDLTKTTILRSFADGVTWTGSGYSMDNRAFLMPQPRTPQQAGHSPICQQCHEDTRNVGTLTAAGGDAAPLVVTPVGAVADQYPVSDNPRFQNFPHETAGYRLLVEAGPPLYRRPVYQLPRA
ncbi:MAG: hypothetical protein CVT66_11370 [Actinobacteria bacterium HGW-Actinobacteria-6]|nr:MAG: hypothetical protein CVT66_11370 [Actinobacteria bacterium HGW-Actinobacteria-6]